MGTKLGGQRLFSSLMQWLWAGLVAGLVMLMGPGMAWGAMAPSQQPLEALQVHLGTEAGELVFEPAQFTLVAGKHYSLLLDNPSPMKHYFTAKDFADVIWTQKVQAGDVEVKGAIHELELRPGAEAEWIFVPQKSGTYELHCSVPGHAEAGMVGEIMIASPEN